MLTDLWNLASGVVSGVSALTGAGKRRRRRRRGIPRKVLADIAQVKAILGPKIAGEVLVTLIAKG